MTSKHIGEQSIAFELPPVILETAAVVGPKEGEGPLRTYFDKISEDILFGQKSWEKAESEMVKQAFELVVGKAGLNMRDIQYVLAGDLLNQSTGSSFGVRSLGRPFFGLFGACSTFGEALSLGSILIDGGFAEYVLAGASSHFCSAEKTFRFPLEQGTQRPPTSSWTVTGDGAVVLSAHGQGPRVTGITTGKIVDMGVSDVNNMGAAMAPAAADVIATHFRDFQIQPGAYDRIITGDLGYIGHELLVKLLAEEGFDISRNSTDCGIQIFDRDTQDTHAGGSGCGCAATTFCGYYYRQMKQNRIRKILLVPTGALHSTVTAQQGESIPGIAQAVQIENA